MIPSSLLERIDPFTRDILSLFLLFHHRDRFVTHSSDEVIPPSPQPPPPPERKITSSPQPVAVAAATAASPSKTVPNPSLARSLYKSIRSSIKPSSSPTRKKITHAQSTPDISTIAAENKKDEDDTSSSLENLSNIYSTMDLSKPRPTGSILKRKPQPKTIQEEPTYVSSASVPLNKSPVRSVQSMVHDQNAKVSTRYFG